MNTKLKITLAATIAALTLATACGELDGIGAPPSDSWPEWAANNPLAGSYMEELGYITGSAAGVDTPSEMMRVCAELGRVSELMLKQPNSPDGEWHKVADNFNRSADHCTAGDFNAATPLMTAGTQHLDQMNANMETVLDGGTP